MSMLFVSFVWKVCVCVWEGGGGIDQNTYITQLTERTYYLKLILGLNNISERERKTSKSLFIVYSRIKPHKMLNMNAF